MSRGGLPEGLPNGNQRSYPKDNLTKLISNFPGGEMSGYRIDL